MIKVVVKLCDIGVELRLFIKQLQIRGTKWKQWEPHLVSSEVIKRCVSPAAAAGGLSHSPPLTLSFLRSSHSLSLYQGNFLLGSPPDCAYGTVCRYLGRTASCFSFSLPFLSPSFIFLDLLFFPSLSLQFYFIIIYVCVCVHACAHV